MHMASLYALLLLLCSPAAAFRLHSFGRATSTPRQRRSATPALRNEAEPLSWKEQIERLLSPETPAEDRGILARERAQPPPTLPSVGSETLLYRPQHNHAKSALRGACSAGGRPSLHSATCARAARHGI